MKITVRYFAAFREAVGTESETFETPADTPEDLFAECKNRHPALQSFSSTLIAINDEMADWDTTLIEGDEVLFFPPVAGG